MALTQVTGGLIASGQTITTPTISGYINLATWTTGTRPGSPTTGQAGFNTTLGVLETYNGTAWVSGGGLNLQAVQTTGFTAVAGNSYPCNTTSAAFTVTLPASPTAGNQVGIFDYAGTFATNNVTLGRNSSNITGVASNYLLQTNRESIILTYVDATQGWAVTSAAYTTTPIIKPPYTASYLIVAGGGGGGNLHGGGGGGAGGLLSGTTTIVQATVYSFTVGGGGSPATSGSNSTGFSLTAIGGGLGGSENGSSGSGGSGGGGAGQPSSNAGGNAGGSGTSGQGNAGAAGTGGSASYGSGGGGGGASVAGSAGGTGNPSNGGAGGNGSASSITGSSVTYAGGGGGGAWYGTGGAGGSGGGARGANSAETPAPSATANTGGGGGGSCGNNSTRVGGSGGSGIVIISVPTANYSGTSTGSPTITTSGSNTILQFTGSGSYTG